MAARKVSNRQLAEAVGVDPATVSQWRSGAFPPSDDNLTAVARYLGRSANWFRAGRDDPRRRPLVSEFPKSDYAAATTEREERLWLSRFRTSLLELDAPDTAIEAAEALVQVPEARHFLAALGDANETAIPAMTWLGSVVIERVRHQLSTGQLSLRGIAPTGIPTARAPREADEDAAPTSVRGMKPSKRNLR